jgi:hypothetical protein
VCTDRIDFDARPNIRSAFQSGGHAVFSLLRPTHEPGNGNIHMCTNNWRVDWNGPCERDVRSPCRNPVNKGPVIGSVVAFRSRSDGRTVASHPRHCPFGSVDLRRVRGWSTSFANPAVTVARTLSDTFAGIKPSSAPMFIIMQLAGVAMAIAVVTFLYPIDQSPPTVTTNPVPTLSKDEN